MSETPPAGYRKLPDGTRCRCIRLWQDGVGGFYCCRSSATLAFADSLSQHCPNCEAQSAEIEKLREVLKEVFEAWAGSEGFIPETAPEGYLLYLTKRMAHIARAALGETK